MAECAFWGDGVVVRTEANKFFCLPDFPDPKVIKLADVGVLGEPVGMAVIEPRYTMSGNVEVLLGSREEEGVMMVDEESLVRLRGSLGRVVKMAVSGNGRMLAAFTEDGRLLVVSTDFTRIIFEYDCQVH